jgi:hypothetical protein
LSHHPYRTQPSAATPHAASSERAWSHSLTAPLIIAAGPVSLVALCLGARAYEGPWLMPSTILYAVLGYVAFLVVACAADAFGTVRSRRPQ